jgi:hypothetical protein
MKHFPHEIRSSSVSNSDRSMDIEALARMAARWAGRDPDEHVRIVLGDVVVFDDVMWRYPDFLERAAAAHSFLATHTGQVNGYITWPSGEHAGAEEHQPARLRRRA